MSLDDIQKRGREIKVQAAAISYHIMTVFIIFQFAFLFLFAAIVTNSSATIGPIAVRLPLILILSVISIIIVSYLWLLLSKPQFIAVVMKGGGSKTIFRKLKYVHIWRPPRSFLARALARQTFVMLQTLVPFLVISGLFFTAVLWTTIILEWNLNQLTNDAVNLAAGLTYSFSLAVFLWLIFRLYGDYVHYCSSTTEPQLKDLINVAYGILPKRVRVRDSCRLILCFEFNEKFVNIPRNKEKTAEELDEYVEVELQAAGLTVDGDKQVRLCETSPLPTVVWDCYFPTAGNRTINLVISRVKLRDNLRGAIKEVVFTQDYGIKVDDLLRISWQPVLLIILSIVTMIATLSNAFGVTH